MKYLEYLLLLLNAYIVYAADPHCSNGIKNWDGSQCCPKDCGTCGGPDCDKRKLGYVNCCSSGVASQKKTCDKNDAPCSILGDPYCSKGFKNSDNTQCCPIKCGQCGGDGCEKRLGGASNCCSSNIKKQGKWCNNNLAPCSISSTDPSPQIDIGKIVPNTKDPMCVTGILTADGKSCCNKACKYCGTSNCAHDVLGAANCCGGDILSSGKKCIDNKPPCIFDLSSSNSLPIDWSKIRRPAIVGMHPGPRMDIFSRESAYGVKLDSIVYYSPVYNLNWSWFEKYINAGLKVQLVIEFTDSADNANLSAIGDGKYDHYLNSFADTAKKDGREIYVRPIHEFNGDWYSWGIFRDGNSIDEFKRAYIHVVKLFKAKGCNFKYQLAYNVKSARNDATPFKDFYPGDDVVDFVCTSIYNFDSSQGEGLYTFKNLFGNWYGQITSFTNKPLCISEMSSNENSDKVKWIKETWDALEKVFTKVLIVNWFFQNKENMWDLNTHDEQLAWIEGFKTFKEDTKTSRRLDDDHGPHINIHSTEL